MPLSPAAEKWIQEVKALCQPDDVYICDGSEEERERLTAEAVTAGELMPLNQDKMPGCYLHRSSPTDVARTEEVTFVCSKTKEEAGPNNNWMAPGQAKDKLTPLFKGAMRGRRMYVVPFVLAPPGSRFSKVGLQVTDSRYVVLNLRIMARMGKVALDQIKDSFTKCLHSIGDLSPDRRFICHFPEENEIWSVGSGYGGNAILSKKCMALRIASALGAKEGWLAEHMFVMGLQPPGGQTRYIAGAFPSGCGKTNLAMLVPPASYPGWKVWTISDDIAWLRIGSDGRLYAANPEAGFFGIAPGTNMKTNPAAMATISHNTMYTNVALRPDNTVWWEGHDDPPSEPLLDWQGQEWTMEAAQKAAHPNSRYTTPATQCPTISPEFNSPEGVPISAILFGARRQRIVPLVCESFSWQHGTFLGATLSSETTAAATGKLGVLRHDPMAMLPFCGYNMADYWSHWLEMGKKMSKPPKIFRVNWFRTDESGKFLWPGYGENIRVLEWIINRCEGKADAEKTMIGNLPKKNAISRRGLDLSDSAMENLLKVYKEDWTDALGRQREFFDKFGERLPEGIREEHELLAQRVADTK